MIGITTIVGSLLCVILFVRGRFRLHPILALLGTWFFTLSVSQLKFSPLQREFSQRYWLVLLIAGIGLFLGWLVSHYIMKKRCTSVKITLLTINPSTRQRVIFWATIIVLFSITTIANIHIFAIFDTFPLFHKDPERLRFTINKIVFGPWEYFAIAPRIIIPIIAAYWFTIRTKLSWEKYALSLSLLTGFCILLLYTSRSTVVFAMLLSYAAYLISKAQTLTIKHIVTSSVITFLLVALFSIAIPATRHYISFKQTYADQHLTTNFQPFAYYYELAELTLPTSISFLVSPYLSLSFNQQALNAAIEYYPNKEAYYQGQLHLSTFAIVQKLLNVTWQKVQVPWVDIFLPWWNTGTFLFSYYVDGGLLVTLFALMLWGFILNVIHNTALQKPNMITILLYSYAIFIAVMSVYTNFVLRPEFYLDILIFLGLGVILNKLLYAQSETNKKT